VVRDLAKSLRKYEGERVWVTPRGPRFRGIERYRKLSDCEEPRGTAEFLSQFPKGTYRHWLVSNDIDKRMEDYKYDIENLKKEIEKAASQKGLAEKKTAIANLLSQLERVERALLDRNAKTFAELHPEVKLNSGPEYPRTEDEVPSANYNLEFGFVGVKDLTVERKNAYFEL